MLELRCDHKLHGLVLDDGRIEVKCNSSFCGASPGVVVLHKIDLRTGDVETTRYKEPPKPKGAANGVGNNVSAIRDAGHPSHSH